MSIRPRERDAILQSLRSGVVPRQGLHHIQVGRAVEVDALLQDIERVADQGSAVRFIIGEYGAGKTFFLTLVRAIAMKKGLVTTQADLNPSRRLQGSAGQARSLYAEMMRNISTQTKPDGGAMEAIVQRFVSTAKQEAGQSGQTVSTIIQERLHDLSSMLGGYDFASVIERYWHGHDNGDDALKNAAIRWLRAEYSTKTEARQALGSVRTIIDDDAIYDSMKLMARFIRHAGFQGLMVSLDEMVNLYKMSNTRARNANYEQVLRILNDALQGASEGLSILFGGTPEFLMDDYRGLYSYEALRSRLAMNAFAKDGLIDLSGPVIRLQNLAPEDLVILLHKLRHVQASGEEENYLLKDADIQAFMHHCAKTIGEAYFRTPRNTIRSFIHLMAVLEQNPGAQVEQLIGKVGIEKDAGENLEPFDDEEEPPSPSAVVATESGDDDDALASFKL